MNHQTTGHSQPPEPREPGRLSSADPTADATRAEVGDTPTLLRPVVHVRSPLLEGTPPASSSSGTPTIQLDSIFRVVGPFLVPVIVVAIPFSVIANGAWLGVAIGTTLAVVVLRAVASRLTFTFAEGFLGFRDKDGWPTGVQEEYDVRYSWPARGALSGGVSSPSH
jgi:hypothetical protein